MRNCLILLSSLLLALGSCKKSSEPPVTYFDSLVVNQIRLLTEEKALLTKMTLLGEHSDQTTTTPDSIAWEHELEIFRQLSAFERPAYRSAYHLEDGLRDDKSNLTVRRYLATQNLPLSQLRFFYYNRFSSLKKIEAMYHQENLLFSTTRKLVMEFEDIQGRSMLSSYSVEGTQKMIFNDTVRFSNHARIRI